MKKIFIISFITTITTGVVFSQSTEKEKTFAVKASILPFLIDNNSNESYVLFSTAIRINAEKKISNNKSLVVELGYAGPVTCDIENGEAGETIATTGIITGVGNKFYVSNDEMKGVYLMPMLNYSFIKLLEHPEGESRIGYVGFRDGGISGVIGFQSSCKHNIVVDIHAGAGVFMRNYYDNTFMESTAVIDHNEVGIKPIIGLSIGKFF